MNKKNIFLWALYDFANSIFTVVFFLYFSQWLVIDKGVADIWYNMLFVGSTILLLLTSLVLGSIADKRGVRMPYLKIITILLLVSLILTSLFGVYSFENKNFVVLAMLFFLLSNYFYQFSFTFYNTLLRELAPAKLLGRISGIGMTAGWIGQIVGLLVTFPLATGAIVFLGEAGRAQTFLPATIFSIIFFLPTLFYFKESGQPQKVVTRLKDAYKESFSEFKKLIRYPGIGRYLLGYFFFNDALLTVVNNFPIYLEQVFKVPDKIKTGLLLGILVTTALGAFITGWLSDKIGLKKALILIVAGWMITVPLMAVVTNFTYFIALTILLGFLYGSTWTVTRAVMTYLAPPQRLNYAFSYYTMAERFSTFVGPVTWGVITSFLFVNTGELRYRIAMFSMAIFIAVGFIIIRKIPSSSPEDVLQS